MDCLSPFTQEDEFEKNQQDLCARLKMYRRGQGYVGKKAAADKDFMGRVLQTLTQAWQSMQNRSEEHTSELQSLMRISYAVFCLKKKKRQHAQIEDIQLT